MNAPTMKLFVVATGLAAIVVMGLFPARGVAQNRPSEVRDLIADHNALAMKIRPLQDRVLTATQPQEGRVPERLRHKDRAASDGDKYGRIMVRLSALEKNARRERERVMQPEFGVGLSRKKSETADARKKLTAMQRELAVLERELNAL